MPGARGVRTRMDGSRSCMERSSARSQVSLGLPLRRVELCLSDRTRKRADLLRGQVAVRRNLDITDFDPDASAGAEVLRRQLALTKGAGCVPRRDQPCRSTEGVRYLLPVVQQEL